MTKSDEITAQMIADLLTDEQLANSGIILAEAKRLIAQRMARPCYEQPLYRIPRTEGGKT